VNSDTVPPRASRTASRRALATDPRTGDPRLEQNLNEGAPGRETMPAVSVSASTQVAPPTGSQTGLRICTYEDTWDSHGYLISEVLISCRYEYA
jgi:hypothetical protein